MSEPIQAIATNNYLLATPIGSGYMETSALEYDGDKISGYAGSAFKAGDEFPQSATDAIGYVTATSANIDSTIDNVSVNSGAWGGSALPISAGHGVKFDMVDGTLVASTDETVLYENWETPIKSTSATGSLAEPLTSFASFEVTWAPWGGRGEPRWEPVIQKFPSYPANSACYYPLFAPWLVEGDGGTYLFMELLSANDTNFCVKEGRFYQYTTTVTGKTTAMDNTKIYKIVGINRTAGGN